MASRTYDATKGLSITIETEELVQFLLFNLKASESPASPTFLNSNAWAVNR